MPEFPGKVNNINEAKQTYLPNGVVLHKRDTCSRDIVTFDPSINRYVNHVCSLEIHDTGVHQCPKCSLVWGM